MTQTTKYGGDLSVVPITRVTAQEFVRRHHRHHPPQVGEKFAIGALRRVHRSHPSFPVDGGRLVGVAVVGRPVSRVLQDGWTLEVTRLATDGTKNACSLLYGAAARAAQALGYRKVITYTLASENGASLRAAGWVDEGPAGGGSWSRPSRQREDVSPTEGKRRWSRTLGDVVPDPPPSLAPAFDQLSLLASDA